MADSDGKGGPGCLVALVAWTVAIAGVLWYFFGWEPREAAATGATWALGIVCGGPVLIVAIVVASLALFGVTDTFSGWRDRRAARRWKQRLDALDDEGR